ncbi:hypothetical protein V8G57_11505 [Collimonas sp. H4R21]|uniref:Uncharacterized protein n=1 Tax=Collimonas rhizosphaerae TaxID=3126357 RepID=A0ABU9PVH9_9BURK
MSIKGASRFLNPGILTDASTLFGVPEKVWHQAFTGNFDKEMVEVRRRVKEMARRNAETIERENSVPPQRK